MAKKKIQAEDIKQAAQGKWADLIFPRFGIEVQWKKKTPPEIERRPTVFLLLA